MFSHQQRSCNYFYLFWLLKRILHCLRKKGGGGVCILFPILVFLFCCFRNNSIIALVISFPVLLYCLAKNRKRLCALFAIGLAAFFLWSGPISQLALSGYTSIEVDHALIHLNSVPTQQLAYAWNDPDLSEEDRELFLQTIDESDKPFLENVRYDNADTARGAFRSVLFRNIDLPAFYKLYIKEGLRHPDAYLRGFLALTYEAWYPFSTPRGYNGGWNTGYSYNESDTSLFACSVEPPAEFDSKFPALYNVLWKISRFDFLQSNPLTAWLVSIPFYLWLLLITFTRALIKREASVIAGCALLLSMVLTFLLGPVVLPRYYLGLFFAAPVMAFCLCGNAEARDDCIRLAAEEDTRAHTSKTAPTPSQHEGVHVHPSSWDNGNNKLRPRCSTFQNVQKGTCRRCRRDVPNCTCRSLG